MSPTIADGLAAAFAETETPVKAAGVLSRGKSDRLFRRTRTCSSGERPLILDPRHDPCVSAAAL